MPRNIIGFTSSSSLPPVNPPSDFIQGFAFTAQDNNGEETPGFSVSVLKSIIQLEKYGKVLIISSILL